MTSLSSILLVLGVTPGDPATSVNPTMPGLPRGIARLLHNIDQQLSVYSKNNFHNLNVKSMRFISVLTHDYYQGRSNEKMAMRLLNPLIPKVLNIFTSHSKYCTKSESNP